MESTTNPESIGRIFHKESSKEKLKTKGLMPLGKRKGERLKENTKVHSQMQMPNVQQTKGEQHINRELSSYRLEKLRKNAEIDSFLEQLLTENIINKDYFAFHAKAIHTLGLPACRKIYIQSLNGETPQRLYAYKIKGALQLHFKIIYEAGQAEI